MGQAHELGPFVLNMEPFRYGAVTVRTIFSGVVEGGVVNVPDVAETPME